ncbi:MAG: hypothetical protein J6A83_01170 [Clostridia bacterium]|nr:hypothetical protein [Clostridia bacterium]
MSREEELLQALMRFDKKIVLNATGADSNLLSNAIARDIRVAYYLSRISSGVSYVMGMPKLTFTVEYQNTEVSPSDIYVVSTADEIQSIMCQYIGNYKTRLVFFARRGLNIVSAYEKFVETRAAFYSNFVGAQITSGEFSAAPMPFCDFFFDYRIGKVKLAMMENETNAEIARIAKQLFLPSMSDETKAFLAHNYLADTIDYTLKENASSLEKSYMQSAYGALIKKKCVCQGYAEAFKRLMDYAGIPCDVVCGQTKDSDTYHAWNILKLNGGADNYHIDVTWDSAGDKVSYTYFGLKDSDFAGERSWNREFNAKCNSGKSLLLEARRGVMRFKGQLIANGASPRILGY